MTKTKKNPPTQTDVLRSIKSVDDLIPHFENIKNICKSTGRDPEVHMHLFANKWMEFMKNDKSTVEDKKGETKRKE